MMLPRNHLTYWNLLIFASHHRSAVRAFRRNQPLRRRRGSMTSKVQNLQASQMFTPSPFTAITLFSQACPIARRTLACCLPTQPTLCWTEWPTLHHSTILFTMRVIKNSCRHKPASRSEFFWCTSALSLSTCWEIRGQRTEFWAIGLIATIMVCWE